MADVGKPAGHRHDNALALLVVAILGVMLVPLPTAMLDLMLAANLTISLLIVMTVLNTPRPIEFSTFPSVLLFTALFRLALNVASTRLILLDGDAGNIIRAFGDFVVGGDYLVGMIVFLILVIIQFVVITRGQGRISEVAARFTLDAMPGKQMAIDADLNAGIITNEEATARRRELAREAEFYGAMDGAGKFVRGDAIAGLIITAVNLLGGLLIGMVNKGLDAGAAFELYAMLTVGDGLVSQIPGLMVSTAAGILVTKNASESGLGTEVGGQLLARPAAMRTVAGVLCGIGLLPGMPTFAFFLLAGTVFLGAGRLQAKKAADAATPATPAENAEAPVEELLGVDRLSIEIGYRLIGLVDPGRHGGLLDHIRALRRQFASEVGIVIPPIRVKDNIQLDPNAYRILLNGQPVATGELRAGHYLAMDPSGQAAPIAGLDTVEPAFGLPAKWISEADKDRAEVAGYTVIDAPSVLVTHLAEVLKNIAHELLSRDDVKALTEHLRQTSPAIVEEVIPGQLSLGQLHQVLAILLREKVPIRNLATILEALADAAHETKDPRALAEKARARLARAILQPHLDPTGTLHAAVIDPALERSLAEAVTGAEGLSALPPGFLARFVDSTADALGKLARSGRDPVLITRAALRPFLAEAVAGTIPNAAVLSYQETAPAKRVETVARIAVPT
ncbi:MAG TPA: flagellar biosynthesis protein FlhA [Planctomycetota bacterium]|nr:flagellar biosynthesis protein FlhA [Planctomycetota bacterium]